MRAKCGGYCYLNNAAISAQYLSARGRVAILDVDYHHGNGTQDIFYDSDQVLYVSLHADPSEAFPYFSGYANEHGEGRGLSFNLNLPLPAGTDDSHYAQALETALAAVRAFSPRYLVVSLGFDTCRGDPLANFNLSPEYFSNLAAGISQIGIPSVIVTEGGYNVSNIGELAVRFVRGWQAPHSHP
jgi:acetoin utilization deacetylase AcuC-like enzyme